MESSKRNFLIMVLASVGILLFALVVMWLLPGHPNNVPATVIGKWTGTADQSGDKYPVVMMVGPDNCTVDYPSLGCGGRARFVKQHGDELEFREKLDHGFDECIQGGTIKMKLISRDTAEWFWIDPNLERHENVQAMLSR